MKNPPGKIAPLKNPAAAPARDRRGTRERLLDAGLRLFAQKGFDGTLIGDLEREAGLKPGTGSFYRHFENKEDVLHEVISREVDRNHSLAELHAAATNGALGDARAELVLRFRMTLLHLDQMSDFIHILIREEDHLSEDARYVREVMIESAREKEAEDFARRIRAGEVVDLDSRALWSVISSALIGHFLAKRYFKVKSVGGVDDEQFVNTLADLLTTRRKQAP